MFTQSQTYTLLVCLAAALAFGYVTARSSHRREKLVGGLPAQFFHFLACSSMVSVVPAVLSSIIFRNEFLFTITLALSLIAFTLLMLLIHAIFEAPARAKIVVVREDKGWTEEDARKSGL